MLAAAGSDYDEVYRIVHRGGEVRWIHDRASAVRDENGSLLKVIGTARDITVQKKLEEQVRQSQKMEAIGLLAGGIAHDFNNILTVIRGYGALLSRDDVPKTDALDAAREIVGGADRAANLTRQLLAFSRSQVMQMQPLDINECISQHSRLLERILGEQVHLQLELHSTPLVCRVDSSMLDQILLNLAVNARDAMEHGGEILFETSHQTVSDDSVVDAAAGHYARIRVSDAGSGISSENLAHIFEPFFSTKGEGKGTGLGLATVFGIVKQHGGAVTVQTAEGQGTTFSIYLPLSDVSPDSNSGLSPEASPRGNGEWILLVEDDPTVLRFTRRLLMRAGYQVLEASHGSEALRIYGENAAKIDLLFTDMVMPGGMNGRELALSIQEQAPSLPVLFTSGYSQEIAGRDLTLSEGQYFLQKPAHPDRLLLLVRTALDASARSRPTS